MSRVLFILFNGAGRVLPGVGVMRALRQMGHEVGLVTVPGEFRPAEPLLPLKALGVELFASPEPPPECHPGAIYPGTDAEQVTRLFYGTKESLGELRHQRQIVPVLPQIDPLRAIISRYRPDIVLVDTLAYQAGIAAHLEGVRSLGYTASLRMVAPPHVRCDVDAVHVTAEARELFARFGMSPEFAWLEYVTPRMNFVFSLPEFVGARGPHADRVTLVGPPAMVARGDDVEFPWERLRADRPLVYVSFGSVMRWQPESVQRVVSATEALGVNCVISAGDLAGGEFPPHVIAVPYAPQIALLQRADVFVTVGGANSMNEALCAGVPLVVMPVLSDQFLQGHFVEASGVGVCLPPSVRSVDSVRDALRRIIDDGTTYKKKLEPVRSAFARADGARTAARAIIDCAR